MKRYSNASDPVTQRISRKIGLLYAAGYIAQREGFLLGQSRAQSKLRATFTNRSSKDWSNQMAHLMT